MKLKILPFMLFRDVPAFPERLNFASISAKRVAGAGNL
jgi:hypothetical protein